MKKITQSVVLIMTLIIVTTSCKKNAVPYTPGTPVPTATVYKLEKDGDQLNAVYNTDGTLHALAHTVGPNGAVLNYVFSYNNGKISEVDFGGKWKYIYTGDQITSVETYVAGGVLKYRTDFAYTNGKVSERTEYFINSANTATPNYRTLIYYRNDGNVDRKIMYQRINGEWKLQEQVVYESYDQFKNVTEPFESYPYLPAGMFSPNNPVKENWTDDLGYLNQAVNHVYTYDINGRPATRKSTFSYPGFPDTFSDLKITY